MSLTTPTLKFINSFDSLSEQDFEFVATGGNQVIKNKLVIRKNLDNQIIYNSTIETFQFNHKLPKATLQNGQQYNAQIFTYDINGNESQGSNIMLFYCLSTPFITITNLNEGKINNSSYEFLGEYSQEENEELESYQYKLYDQNQVLISASSSKYDSSLVHTFSGLKNNHIYYIELRVLTLNGLEATTGLQQFIANYISPMVCAVMNLENIPEIGAIKANINVINIEGKSNPNPPKYIDGEYIDLTSTDSWVRFNEGFSLEGDFTLKVWAKNLTNRETFMILYNLDDTESNKRRILMEYFDDVIRVYQKYGEMTYFICSNKINTPLNNDLIYIWLRRKNGLYDLKLKNLSNQEVVE